MPCPPVAIVGIGCRLPGGVNSPDDFWEVIRNGQDTITEVPADRWSLDTFYHPDQSKQGKMVSRKGGFIEGIAKFDNSFFKMSPKEATSTDPQQRILLEVVHEAFEDAGIVSDTLGTSTGVYVGMGTHDYSVQTLSDNSLTNPYTLTGTSHSTAANRISFVFDLKGPSYSVDTACASSVTAIHLACTGLWNRECETAVVAGCNAIILPETSVALSALGVMSKDDKCCPFSSTAKGYVRSEGWGALILKTVQKADIDGDHIYALIRGTAIAANGFSNSITMPSCTAQAYVMEQAYTRSGVSLSDVLYVEAHGTGTPVGDPIEAEAIGQTFGPHRQIPLKIGSAKGNFGHNEAASGVTAVIKVALMLHHQMLCPTINFVDINPKIKIDDWNLQVQTQLERISSTPDKKTTIGLNSAGFGGAVGHVVLEEAPKSSIHHDTSSKFAGWMFGGNITGEPIIVPLSAKSKEALKDVAELWRKFSSDTDALQVVSWLSTRRKHYDLRLAVITNSGELFRQQMTQYLNTESGSDISFGAVTSKKPKICFVFPGQGQQWGRMGQQLFLKENVFRETVLKCDEIFKQLSGWSLLYDKHVFLANGSADSDILDDKMKSIAILQPAILFFQIGVLHLLRSWGVLPDVVIAHSLGEIAGAYASGGYSLYDAIRTIYHRSAEQANIEGSGSMAALRLPLSEAKDLCQKYDKVYVAAINAPTAITIAGHTDSISDIVLNNPTVAKQLRVQCAFHTSFMDPLETSFRAASEGAVTTKPESGSIPFYSTVTGKLYLGEFDTDYWWRNIRNKVEFQAAMEEVFKDTEVDVVLEVSASATLLSSVNQIYKKLFGETNLKLIPLGQRDQNDHFSVLRALANLYAAGCGIEWQNVTSASSSWVRLPTYPWQHQSYWLETDERRKRRLGQDDRTFTGQAGKISLEIFPFLADHVVQDRLVFPVAGFVEMMIEFAFAESECPALSKVSFNKVLAWTPSNDGHTTPLGIVCSREGSKIKVTSKNATYSSAMIQTSRKSEDSLLLAEILPRCETHVAGENIYKKLGELGLQYGPSFQVIRDAACGDDEIVGFLLPAPLTNNKQRLQVTHLDSCFQLLGFASGASSSLYLPVAIQSIQMTTSSLPTADILVAYVRVTAFDSATLMGDFTISTLDGRVLLKARNCECHNVTGTKTDVRLESCLYTTGMQSIQSRLPTTSIVTEKFEVDYLLSKFPDEMGFIARAEGFIPSLEAICTSYTHQACTDIPEEQVDKSSILYGKGSKTSLDATKIYEAPIKDAESVLDNIQTNLPEIQREVAHLRSLNSNLPGVAASEVDIADSAISQLFYKAAADIIHSAVNVALQRKKIVRILDLGTQVGCLGKYVLPLLSEHCEETHVEYTCSFAASCPEDQKVELPFIKFRKFNIKGDVLSQGLVPGSFDIIICMNNINLSDDLKSGLQNIHKLLYDGGWFLMCELTSCTCVSNVLFGRRHKNSQEGTCFMAQEEWKDVLRTSRFRDVVAASTPQEFFQSIFACRKSTDGRKEDLLKHARVSPTFVLVTDQQATSSPANLTSLLCEKLNIARGNIFHGGQISKDISSQNDTQDGNLVCIYKQSGGSLYQLTELLQGIESKMLNFGKVFVVTCGKKTDAAQVIGFVQSVTNGIQTPIYSIHLNDTLPENVESLVMIMADEDVQDRELIIHNGEVTVPRVLRTTLCDKDDKDDGSHWQLVLAQSKNTSIEDLGFSLLRDLEPLPGEVVVNVKSSALNFKDVMVSLGQLDGLEDAEDMPHFGLECSGIIEKVGDGVRFFNVGDEVMGFGKHCFASHTICDAVLLVHKLSKLEWSEAASVSVVFATAYYSLIERANLQKDETVLIHSACGGVGLAAIQVAKMVGARIICSAGSDKKRLYLKNELGIEMVTDSRSEKFYEDVMTWTCGSGADVVLNSLHGDKLSKGIEALAPGGRFCEIGKRDILENSSLQMNLLLENKSFMSCQIDRLIQRQPAKLHQVLLRVASLLGAEGSLTPIPMTTCTIGDYQDVFTNMAKGDHIGKMVFDCLSDFKPSKLLPSSTIFDANATYIVTGGYGGLGLSLVQWLCNKGVRYLALVSRRGCHTSAARRTVNNVTKKGTRVFEFARDVSKASDVQALLNKLENNPNAPVVKGIFHLAGCILDESLSTLTPEMMDKILGAKANGACNLHNLTRHLPLHIFFMMSSSVVLWGHSSQPCYSAANAYLDALSEERRDLGLPAISLQLCPVRGAGFLEYNSDHARTLEMKGIFTLHIEEVLQMMERILQAKQTPAVICLSHQDFNKTLQFCHKGILRFRHLTELQPRQPMRSTEDREKHLENMVRQKMARLLCLVPESIDLQQPMVNYGVDSLMAVEMSAWSAKELNVYITQAEILTGITTGAFLQKVQMSQN